MPEDVQSEIFNTKLMESLVMNILNLKSVFKRLRYDGNSLDPRRTELAVMLLESGIEFCIAQCKLQFGEHDSLTGPIIKHLNETVNICKDIADKLELDRENKYAEESKSEFLFKWDRMNTGDKRRLENFVSNEIGLSVPVLDWKKDRHRNSLVCSFGDKEMGMQVELEVKVNFAKRNGEAIIRSGKNAKHFKLMVRQDNQNTFIYKK
jgi:hypothetical protein